MSYTTTELNINLNLIDTTAKNDSAISVLNISSQLFSNISTLNTEGLFNDCYMTLEHNYSTLNGKMYEFKDLEEYDPSYMYAYYTTVLSNNNREFSSNPKINVSFNSEHTSAGITLYFGGNYPPAEIKVTYYDSSGAILLDKLFYPNENIFFCSSVVKNYKQINIEFLKTFAPNEYIKLNRIDYGLQYYFTNESLIKANIFEETDIISSKLSTDTLEFTSYNPNNDFNQFLEDSLFYTLQVSQKVLVSGTINTYNDNHELIKTSNISFGTFYLDSFENVSKNEVRFKCIDAIGLLSKDRFEYSHLYNNISIEDVILAIFSESKFNQYEIDESVLAKNFKVNGYIPKCTCREALQQICFAFGLIADCCRSDYIRIYLPNNAVSSDINSSRKIGTDKITNGKKVYASTITIHNLSKDTKIVNGVTQDNIQNIYKKKLSVGTHIIVFDNPIYQITGFNSEIVSSVSLYPNCLYVGSIVVHTEGTAELFGIRYIDLKSEYKKTLLPNGISNLEDNDLLRNYNTINIDNCYLVSNSDFAESLANNVLNYYAENIQVKIKYMLENERPGNKVSVAVDFSEQFKAQAYILNQDINLTEGFVTEATLVKYVIREQSGIYAGDDSVTGSVADIYTQSGLNGMIGLI